MKFRSIYLFAALPMMIGAAMPFAIANPDHQMFQLAQAADEFPESGRKSKGERRQKMIEALNLSDEQVQKLEAIRGDAKSVKQDNYDELKTEMEAMRTLVSNSASTDELRSQHQKIKAIKQKMGNERFEKMLQMYEILTPEQRKVFAEKMKMRHGKKGHFGGHRSRREKTGELQSLLVF